jgi:uncharacterized protein with PIN domain
MDKKTCIKCDVEFERVLDRNGKPVPFLTGIGPVMEKWACPECGRVVWREQETPDKNRAAS